MTVSIEYLKTMPISRAINALVAASQSEDDKAELDAAMKKYGPESGVVTAIKAGQAERAGDVHGKIITLVQQAKEVGITLLVEPAPNPLQIAALGGVSMVGICDWRKEEALGLIQRDGGATKTKLAMATGIKADKVSDLVSKLNDDEKLQKLGTVAFDYVTDTYAWVQKAVTVAVAA